MPLVNNKVGDESTAGSDGTLTEVQALVESLIKVVACHRQLASCVGGCTDSLQLRDELRLTRERALKLAMSTCHQLTLSLRDKGLPEEQRRHSELLWVGFSSSLELLHLDMCKVFRMAEIFTIADESSLVLTGLQGGGTEVAARALSLPDLHQPEPTAPPAGLEGLERCSLEQDISRMDHMIEDMETKVNVLRWMVEPQGALFPNSSTDSMSMALLSVEEEECPVAEAEPVSLCRGHLWAVVLLSAVVTVVTTLSVCVVLFT